MSQPLRILQVLRAPIGGLFRHVADLTEALAARGHEIAVVADSLTADALTESRFAALSPFARLGIHRLPIPRTAGMGDLTTPLRLRRLADSLAIDVLHGHGAKGGLHARLARIGSRRAALYTPHGGVLHFAASSASGKLFRLAEKLTLPQSDAIIFESAFAQKAYLGTIGTPACPCPVVHNGLRDAEFEPVPLAPDAADFAFVGELRTLKGVGTMLQAFAQMPETSRLVIAGDGPDRARFEAETKTLGLVGRVQFLGARPARQVFAMGRCLLVPSLAESLPYIVLEGIAAGRPVIATDVGGVGEITGPTSDTLLPAGDATALADAMRRFLADPAPALAEAEQRFAYIRQRFSVATMTDAIEALYRQAIDRRST
jgi:glycosyltransferase involved in cell wall biosynthesis